MKVEPRPNNAVRQSLKLVGVVALVTAVVLLSMKRETGLGLKVATSNSKEALDWRACRDGLGKHLLSVTKDASPNIFMGMFPADSDGIFSFVDEDGNTQLMQLGQGAEIVTGNQNSLPGYVQKKVKDFPLVLVKEKHWSTPTGERAQRIIFTFGDGSAVVADTSSCRIRGVYVGTADGSLHPDIRQEVADHREVMEDYGVGGGLGGSGGGSKQKPWFKKQRKKRSGHDCPLGTHPSEGKCTCAEKCYRNGFEKRGVCVGKGPWCGPKSIKDCPNGYKDGFFIGQGCDKTHGCHCGEFAPRGSCAKACCCRGYS